MRLLARGIKGICYVVIVLTLRMLFTLAFSSWRLGNLAKRILLHLADSLWKTGSEHILSVEPVLNKPNPITLELSRMVGLDKLTKERMLTLKYMYSQTI